MADDAEKASLNITPPSRVLGRICEANKPPYYARVAYATSYAIPVHQRVLRRERDSKRVKKEGDYP